MRCLKVGFRRHVVIWFCMAVAANIAPAMAQRFDGIILQPAPVQDSKALYEIELWQMTVRMEEVENSSVNGIEQLLTLVRPKNIEIQGL